MLGATLIINHIARDFYTPGLDMKLAWTNKTYIKMDVLCLGQQYIGWPRRKCADNSL